MVTIRFTTWRREKRPFHQVVVADARFARDGRLLSVLVSLTHWLPARLKVNLDLERIQHLVRCMGSDRVAKLDRRRF